MRKYLLNLILCLCFLLGAGTTAAAEELIIYTSMKDSLMEKLKADFERSHPDVSLRYESAGAGKIMAKIKTERESGKILADLLWTSEVPDFYALKAEGLLATYVPTDIKMTLNPFPDYDGSFTAARLGTLGIAYNTELVKTAPVAWRNLEESQFKDAFGVADPAKSGTSYMSVALLVHKFGWEFWEGLAANGTKIGADSRGVVEDVAEGKLAACLAVDYIAHDLIAKGAPMALAYPPQMLVVPSPVAIISTSLHPELARKFVDYLLSKEAQTIIAGEGTLPVRPDVPLPEKYGLPLPTDALKRSIPINYGWLKERKAEIITKFNATMGHAQ